jgi:ABC-type amino acid transport system permease subunit
MSTFEILWQFKQAFADGLRLTLEIATSVWLIGLIFGSLLGTGAHKYANTLG